MIRKSGNCFKIDTPSTSLLLREDGEYVELLHYGARLADAEDYPVFGRGVKTEAFASCDDRITARLPYSSVGWGNEGESLVILKNADGSYVNRFAYEGYEILRGGEPAEGLPVSRDKSQTLVIKLEDRYAKIELELCFSVFDDCDAIAVYTKLRNRGDRPVAVLRCLSLQMDFCGDFTLSTFDGAWARERHRTDRTLKEGITAIDSKGGWSSNVHNPFVLLRRRDRAPGAYGFNLVYSGNHKEIFEVRGSVTRVLTGMNDYLFDYTLLPSACFRSPEAVVVYGDVESDVTERMHRFVRRHIVDPAFANLERPVLFNSWEAMYFRLDRAKMTSLLSAAKEIGVELFVLDDGWFGCRDSDEKSLGDWFTENPKIEGGLTDFVREVKAQGLRFGIWLEPEMLNAESELYRTHPEFVMRSGREPIERRHQLVLDLTLPAVRKYIIEAVSDVVKKYDPDYIKWDCNRNMTDMYGAAFQNQGEYFHRYMLGLYEVLSALREKFPRILFESCASGGNRYDLGMLYYMPQTWASDNTDAFERLFIQEGTLCGYPQSTMGAHISACPNHQTGNSVSLENRFNIAAAGIFGLELDLTACTSEELNVLKNQIAYYKRHRTLLQTGKYYRLDSVFEGEYAGWTIVSEDRSEAMATLVVKRRRNQGGREKFFLKGLDPSALYRVERRRQANEAGEEISFTASGEALMSFGAEFGDLCADADRAANSNSLGSRMFFLKRVI